MSFSATNRQHLDVSGYEAHGDINTALDLAVLCQINRFKLVIDVGDQVPKLQAVGTHIKEQMKNQPLENVRCAQREGIDKPEFTDWKWPDGLRQALVQPAGGC